MAYDLLNRRDTATGHHTSVTGANEVVQNYLAIGAPPSKINLGFAFYAKYFQTAGSCAVTPLNCPIVPAEDPVTGKDTLTSGAWTFEPAHMLPVNATSLATSWDGTCGPDKGTKCATGCCSQYGNCGVTKEHCNGACQHAFGVGCTDPDIAGSWQLAAANGVADEEAGGQYYLDAANKLFWTWDTPEFIGRKFEDIVRKYGLGGVMAWSLGEDSNDWSHIKRISAELEKGGGKVLEEALPVQSSPASAEKPKETYIVVNVDGTGGSDDDDDEWVYYDDDEDSDVDESSEGEES
ncbi:hypothetical protein N0V90_010730 [Kalmusia sp. IMI 367209]|nr:hypothetical protein N0V90_010730 [Kalmusia sp. IMI 367209]